MVICSICSFLPLIIQSFNLYAVFRTPKPKYRPTDLILIWSIPYPIHSLSDPFVIQSICYLIHSLSDPFVIRSIRYPIHLLSDPFVIWSIWLLFGWGIQVLYKMFPVWQNVSCLTKHMLTFFKGYLLLIIYMVAPWSDESGIFQPIQCWVLNSLDLLSLAEKV